MTDRLTALAAALLLAVTLAACGEADSKDPGTQPDTTPNGSITTQPDTNGSDHDDAPGDSMNGGKNETGGAEPGDGAMAPEDTGSLADEARSRKYDRALAASLSQLILDRIGD